MAERQILRDAIRIGRPQDRGFSHGPAPFRALALKQMPPAGAAEQHLAAGGDFETFGYGFSSFNSFGTAHRVLLLLEPRKRLPHKKERNRDKNTGQNPNREYSEHDARSAATFHRVAGHSEREAKP